MSDPGDTVAARTQAGGVLIIVSKRFRAAGELAAANAVCREAIVLTKDDADLQCRALLEAGQTARALAWDEEAAAYLDRAAASGGGALATLLALGTELRAAGRQTAALAVYGRVLAGHPGHIEALVESGLLARALRQRDAALDYFQTAVAQGGDHTWPLIHAGVELRERGRCDEALAHFDMALARPGDHVPALLEAGVAARQLGAMDRAAAYFARAIERVPGNIGARHHLASALRAGQRWAAAAEAYDGILTLDATNIEALIESGLLARRAGDPVKALERFERAASAAPTLPWPRIHCGVQYRDRGMNAEARAHLDAALAHAPTHLYALLEAGITARLQRRTDDAIRHFQFAVAQHPSSVPAHTQLLSELRLAGRLDDARAAGDAAAAAVNGDQPELNFERMLLDIAAQSDAVSVARAESIFVANFDAAYQMLEERVRNARLSLHFLTDAGRRYMEAVAASPPALLTPEAVSERILAAAHDRLPLAVIRAADGEGAFLSYFERAALDAAGPNDAAQSLHALVVGNTIWRRAWFKTDIYAEDPARLAALKDAFLATLASADVVGIPAAETFPRLNGYVDFHGCTTIHRTVSSLRPAGITGAEIAVQLHSQCNLYARLLTGLPFLGLVSCHPGLADILRSEFSIPDVAFYHIPHAVNQEQVFGYAPHHMTGARHYPDVYDALRAELQVPYQGAVFLVAAGLLGKIYCGWIRQRGGIAIDIGAMADAFAGFNTRPSIHRICSERPLRALQANH